MYKNKNLEIMKMVEMYFFFFFLAFMTLHLFYIYLFVVNIIYMNITFVIIIEEVFSLFQIPGFHTNCKREFKNPFVTCGLGIVSS